MKLLKEILRVEGYEPATKDGDGFVKKHKVKVTKDANKNGDDVFNASKVKPVQRQPKHGYNPGQDEKVYEDYPHDAPDFSDKEKKELENLAKSNAKVKRPKRDDEANESYQLTEKLNVSDGIAAWIKDFVHSKNPKFAGKSRKERIEMAKGAFYAAKRGK